MTWFRKKPQGYVRLHMQDFESSIEGVLMGRWAGHYIIHAPKLVSESDTLPLDGHLEVPAERVLFLQFLQGISQ